MDEQFFVRMKGFFPNIEMEYNEIIEVYGEFFETIVIDDVLMPKIIKLLVENREVDKLRAIFEYIEEVVASDVHMKDILSITMMEKLGDNDDVLAIAKSYMGDLSKELQIEADKIIGRIHEPVL